MNMKRIILALFICIGVVSIASAQEKVKEVLCIGNSFTFFYDSHKRLAELAESQGHKLKVNAQYVGGYTFQRHLNRDETMGAIVYGKFDYVFLQDQSRTPALYGQDPKRCALLGEDAKELADRVRIYSPNAKIWIEQTWSYSEGNYGGFGSYEEFDKWLKIGTEKMAKKASTDVSPIGDAFAICRAERPDINLYEPDHKHQSALGTYLKACVNYLLIFGEPFSAKATDCGNDYEKAAYLRMLAERVVLK